LSFIDAVFAVLITGSFGTATPDRQIVSRVFDGGGFDISMRRKIGDSHGTLNELFATLLATLKPGSLACCERAQRHCSSASRRTAGAVCLGCS